MNKINYIGMDAHSSNCVFSVMDKEGVEHDNVSIETNGRQLINYIRSIGGRKKLTFEECELSGWLCELLKEEVEEILVCNPVANRDYKRAKTDKLDARRLANLLRGGFLTPVFHNGSKREQYRVLMSGYQALVDEAICLKNRYKSMFRKSGHMVRGDGVYNDESLLKDLKGAEMKFVGERLYSLLAPMEEARRKYVKEIRRVNKEFKEVRYLKSIPGIADIQAAKICSQVIDANRFSSKYKYYSYCGLVRQKRSSGGREYGNKKIHGNRVLKCVYKMAGKSAIRGNNGLRRYYDRLRTKGVSEKNAYNAVCRKIAAISLSIMKHKRRYNDHMIDNPLK